MDVDHNIIPMPIRTIFCHPDNKHWIKGNILADYITIIATPLLQANHYLATDDITCTPIVRPYFDEDDFINNKVTIVITYTFK